MCAMQIQHSMLLIAHATVCIANNRCNANVCSLPAKRKAPLKNSCTEAAACSVKSQESKKRRNLKSELMIYIYTFRSQTCSNIACVMLVI